MSGALRIRLVPLPGTATNCGEVSSPPGPYREPPDFMAASPSSSRSGAPRAPSATTFPSGYTSPPSSM
eukprot:14258984-Alexandrium_andersonii.AAC.1